ncbi:HdeD family acid-resistance protein [Isoptericola sediminis]|uniref:Acid-resistance membrane protein n=1 Tax=Isoptericola sediminis TaxID=2733572 RepID=A0A849K118_9MICO|nr:DUF308 domain-containing protein [Isoptericola sediminis]NNU26381.1 hypothetical protein [Isoptericola sediminis]
MSFYTFTPPADLAQIARRIWYWPVVRGVLAVVFGLLAMVLPRDVPDLLVQVFGAFVLVDGLVSLVDGLRRRGTPAGSGNLGIGVVAVAFGAALLFLPGVFLTIAVVLVGIWAMIFGLLQIVGAFAVRGRGGASWLLSLLSGILFVALAVVCFANPGTAITAMAVVVGVFAVVIGAALIALGVKLRSIGRQPGPAGSGHEVIEGEIVEE